MQEFFESVGVSKSKCIKKITDKNVIKSELKLSLIDTFQGSFGVRVGLAEHRQLNLLQETVSEEAAENFMRLIKASSHDSPEILRQEIEQYQREPSVKFKYLIKHFMELESDLVLEWGSVNPEKGEIAKLPFHKIVEAFDVISKFELETQNRFVVIGRLIVGGVGEKKEKRIFLLSDEINKKDYKGHISQELINSLNGKIGLNEIYQATIEEELTINPVTGEEITNYTLLSLRKIIHNNI